MNLPCGLLSALQGFSLPTAANGQSLAPRSVRGLWSEPHAVPFGPGVVVRLGFSPDVGTRSAFQDHGQCATI